MAAVLNSQPREHGQQLQARTETLCAQEGEVERGSNAVVQQANQPLGGGGSLRTSAAHLVMERG
jgi:hypothetical protein